MTTDLRARNALAIALLGAGILIFGLGWFAGAALLWSSPTWRLREKILATVLVPGGLPMAVLIAGFGLPVTDAARVPGLVGALQVVVIAAPVAVLAYLARQAFGAPGRSSRPAPLAG